MLQIGTNELYFCNNKQKQNILKLKVMNTENTLSRLSSMISSESYSNLVDMINEMGLELMDINIA